jgi:hypothetical protein
MATYKLHWPNTLAQNARIRLGRAPMAAIVAASLTAGCLAGWLLIGWVIWPVQYTGEAYTYDLNAAEKEEYVAAVADSYAVTRQIDVVRRRFQTWTSEEKVAALAQLYAEDQAQGNAAEAGIVIDMAFELRRWEGWDPATIEQVTGQVAAQYNRQGAPGKAQAVAVFAAALGAAPVPVLASGPGSQGGAPRVAVLEETLPDISEGLLIALRLCGVLLALMLVAIAFLLIRRRIARRPVTAAQAASPGEWVTAGPAPLVQWETVYELGMDSFDEACAIEMENGETLGECGMGISESLEESAPRRVIAFEVWLFDKDDLRTVARVLMSDTAYCDDALRQKLSSRGAPLLAAPGTTFSLATSSLTVEARIVKVGYGDDTHSYFDRLTLSLAAHLVAEGVSPIDA